MEQRVPILVYHHVYPDEEAGLTDTARHRATGVIGESAFRRQMSYIADSGWSVVSTTRVVDWLEGGAALPARSVALHFDNGWLDAFTMALPVLRGLAMTGTCYVITDGTGAASEGRAATVRTSTEGAVDKPFITWDHASEMLSDGWEIGAHTASHPRLADVHASDGDDGVLAEVERSNAAFAERLGSVPAHFAYPSGSRNEFTDALLAPHYRSLRLWRYSHPPRWTFTDRDTSPLALDCQNADNTVSFEDFTAIFREALGD